MKSITILRNIAMKAKPQLFKKTLPQKTLLQETLLKNHLHYKKTPFAKKHPRNTATKNIIIERPKNTTTTTTTTKTPPLLALSVNRIIYGRTTILHLQKDTECKLNQKNSKMLSERILQGSLIMMPSVGLKDGFFLLCAA